MFIKRFCKLMCLVLTISLANPIQTGWRYYFGSDLSSMLNKYQRYIISAIVIAALPTLFYLQKWFGYEKKKEVDEEKTETDKTVEAITKKRETAFTIDAFIFKENPNSKYSKERVEAIINFINKKFSHGHNKILNDKDKLSLRNPQRTDLFESMSETILCENKDSDICKEFQNNKALILTEDEVDAAIKIYNARVSVVIALEKDAQRLSDTLTKFTTLLTKCKEFINIKYGTVKDYFVDPLTEMIKVIEKFKDMLKKLDKSYDKQILNVPIISKDKQQLTIGKWRTNIDQLASTNKEDLGDINQLLNKFVSLEELVHNYEKNPETYKNQLSPYLQNLNNITLKTGEGKLIFEELQRISKLLPQVK